MSIQFKLVQFVRLEQVMTGYVKLNHSRPVQCRWDWLRQVRIC